MPGVRPGALLGHTPGLWTPPSAGGVFNPLSLSPAVWYDFSTLAGADGSAIASIADLSGNARTASQATGTLQPLVKAGVNGINGLKVGLSDGVDDTLTSTSFSLAQPFVVYAVVTGGGSGPLRYFSSLDLAARVGWANNGPSNFAGTEITVANGTTAAPKVVTSVFNGASSLIRVDGVQVLTGDAGAGTIATGVSVFSTGAFQFWNGKIGEVLLQPGASVSTSYEAALKAKWGTP
jgi:hypothetical protein